MASSAIPARKEAVPLRDEVQNYPRGEGGRIFLPKQLPPRRQAPDPS